MDKIILIPSLILGLIFVAFYAYRCREENKSFNLSVMVNAILQASGVVCGFFLIVGSVLDKAMKYLTGINLYIFIGGLAVLVVSIQGLYRDIFRRKK